MTLLRRPFVPILIVALLGLVAGCGGSSSSSDSSSTPTITSAPAETESSAPGGAARAAYVEEADAICQANDEVTASIDRELAELTKSGSSETPRGEAKLSELLVRIVFIGREEGKELASIQPPPADAATITRWINTGQEGLSELEAAARALEDGSPKPFGDLYAKALATLERAHGIVKDYGFKVCGAEVQAIR